MTQIKSIFPDIPSKDIAASRDFYVGLLGLTVAWESDWYVLLHGDGPDIQLAIVEHGHDSIPANHHHAASGVLITFEVDDATALWGRAQELKLEVAQELRDEEVGQRHFMVLDPNGLLVDVVETLFVPDAN
ncbi:VOC family protein [Nocardia sp. NPDC051832]|uniref:VOC family protein n=1 Tax=Nocardia sp. NPDC051832 TaxID=3155673 RepID=UPI00341B6531